MPKLKLKRTPAEEREHELRKAKKRAKRAAKAHAASSDGYGFVFDLPEPPLATYAHHGSNDAWDENGEGCNDSGPSRTSDADYQDILRELEERRFREKLADALDADESDSWTRVDRMEAHMNDYAHVPHRWRTGSRRYEEAPERGEGLLEDMDDDEYAEWVRRGMWR
jgi:hypothetical protein